MGSVQVPLLGIRGDLIIVGEAGGFVTFLVDRGMEEIIILLVPSERGPSLSELVATAWMTLVDEGGQGENAGTLHDPGLLILQDLAGSSEKQRETYFFLDLGEVTMSQEFSEIYS